MNARAPLAIAMALSLAGCGQTGALYLPDEGTSTPVEIRPIGGAAPATAPTDAPATPAPAPAPAPATPTPTNDDERKPAGTAAPAPTSAP